MRTTFVKILFLFILIKGPCLHGENIRSHRDPKPKIVFLVSKDPLNYKAHETIPRYAEKLKKTGHYKVQVLEAKGDRKSAHIPHISSIKKADLLVVFCRRLALKPDQMEVLKSYVKEGNPVVGIRTANHGFSIRENVPEGYMDWWEFVPIVLGGENRGYEPEALGTRLSIVEKNKDHEILNGINTKGWKSNGQVYKMKPLLDLNVTILLTGSTENVTEPSAWTRSTKYGGKVFYTALGYPDDFNNPNFVTLLTNGIKWALNP